jgi:hypothetical protein
MGRNSLDVGSGPTPHNPGAILNILLMADMAIHRFMRTLLPSLPCRFHDVAGTAEAGIVFHVVIKTVAPQAEADDCQEQHAQQDLPTVTQGSIQISNHCKVSSVTTPMGILPF